MWGGDEQYIRTGKIFFCVMGGITPILYFLFLGIVNQAVVFDGQGIYTRNLYKVIRRVKWEDVTEIRKDKMAADPRAPKYDHG